MGKINEQIQFPPSIDSQLKKVLYDSMQATARKVNGISSGVFAYVDGVSATVPAAGTWAKGDFIRKTNPVEAGVALSKYVIVGWVRITDGSANVLNTDWLECRFLTGN